MGGGIGPGASECTPPAAPSSTLCEATGSGHCYYIDAASGDDATGDGSADKPWRTLANVVSYYGTPGAQGSTVKPTNAVDLAPGDVVYLFDGTYADVYNYQGQEQVARFRNVNGTSSDPIRLTAYPGQKPVVSPSSQAVGILLAQLSHFQIEGLEITGAYGAGLRVEEADDVRIERVHIHDTDGVDNNNIAGLSVVGSTSISVGCSDLHDNYDRTNADTNGQATENSSNVVLFGGGGVRVHHSRLWQTPAPNADKTGGCIKYKHAATDSSASFEVDHNEIASCKFFSVGTGTAHSHVHHNVIRDGAGLVSRDFGGPTHQTDQVFEYNTLYLARGLALNPTDDWSDTTYDDPQGIVFRRNIVVYDLAQSSQENAAVVIGTYASDALYDKTVPELEFTDNCYFNTTGSVDFSLFAAGGSWGAKGDLYSFADWQGLGFDTASVVADPKLADPAGGDFTPAAASPCAAMGAFAP